MDGDSNVAASAGSPIEPWLLARLRCPLTRQRLSLMTRAEMQAHGLEGPAALIREDRTVYYAFENGLPVLLPDRAIPLAPASH